MQKTILVAEDDPDDLFLVSKALNRIDDQLHIITARNGREVLHALDHGLAPAAILLDLNMPILDGREVLSALQTMRLSRNIPVFVLSTSTEDSDRQQCLRLGARGYIAKPATVGVYVEVLNRFLVDHIGYENLGTSR